METDTDIVAIARAALAEFGSDAARVMAMRARDHALADEAEGMELWRRVTGAVLEMSRTAVC